MADTPNRLRRWAGEMRMGYNLSADQAPLLSAAADEIERLRALVREAIDFDRHNAEQFCAMPHRLAESGWFKRARAAIADEQKVVSADGA